MNTKNQIRSGLLLATAVAGLAAAVFTPPEAFATVGDTFTQGDLIYTAHDPIRQENLPLLQFLSKKLANTPKTSV